MKPVSILAFCLAAHCNAHAERIDLKLLGQSGDHLFMSVPKSHAANQAYLTQVARNMCMLKNHCYVKIWEAGKHAAKKFPLTDAQLKHQLVSYDQNNYTNLQRWLWNCEKFPGTPKEQCL